MIQRIQSFYLVLTSLLSFLFLEGSFLRFLNNTGAEIILNFKGLWQSEGTERLLMKFSHLPLSSAMILIALLSFTAIFFYKKRKLQIKLTFILIILDIISIALLTYFTFSIAHNYLADLALTARMFIPVLNLIFSVLAYRGIKKDEDLVRSYDRLR